MKFLRKCARFELVVPAAHSLLAVMLLMVFGMAQAQSVQGSVSGNVHDQQGAVVPGATVTLTNIEEGVKRTTTTNCCGRLSVSGCEGGPIYGRDCA